jgi:hypothetical protein
MLIRWGSLLMLAVVLTACVGETSKRPAAPRDETTPSALHQGTADAMHAVHDSTVVAQVIG